MNGSLKMNSALVSLVTLPRLHMAIRGFVTEVEAPVAEKNSTSSGWARFTEPPMSGAESPLVGGAVRPGVAV
jgi:hypothetical protein